MIDNDLLLFIEPEGEPAKWPIIDEITLSMTEAYRRGIPGGEQDKKISVKRENKPPNMLIEMPWNKKYDFITHNGWMGYHDCSCGTQSKAHNFLLPTGDVVNSLCIHYLAFHRDEVPQEQLNKIFIWTLYDKNIEPTDKELAWPPRIKGEVKPMTRAEYLESIGDSR